MSTWYAHYDILGNIVADDFAQAVDVANQIATLHGWKIAQVGINPLAIHTAYYDYDTWLKERWSL